MNVVSDLQPLLEKLKTFIWKYWIAVAVGAVVFGVMFFLYSFRHLSIGGMQHFQAELSAQMYLGSLHAAQKEYSKEANPASYAGTIPEILSDQVDDIDGAFRFGTTLGRPLEGYQIDMQPGGTQEYRGATVHTAWSAAAWPVNYGETGKISFYIDETGILRSGDLEGQRGSAELSAGR